MAHYVALPIIVVLAFAVSAAPARADSLIEGAKACTQYFPENEHSQRIPVHLLAAIASAESGRWHEGLNMPLPWPWTINAAGKGYYFDSKAEAIAKANALRAQGITSMDVGCMQVNLKHHSNAFANLEEAFDPKKNVAYAAKFLRTNYDDLGDWVRATAAYHSRTPNLGSKYLKRIEVTWNRIVERVRLAQAKSGGSMADIPTENPMSMKVTSPQMQQSIPGTHGVKVLKVNDAGTATEPDQSVVATAPEMQKPAPILIVKPAAELQANASAPVQVAQVIDSRRDDLLVAGNPLRDLAKGAPPAALDKTGTSAQKRSATRFVFAY